MGGMVASSALSNPASSLGTVVALVVVDAAQAFQSGIRVHMATGMELVPAFS